MYCEIVRGEPRHHGECIEYANVRSFVRDSYGVPAFRSIYTFDESGRDHVAKHGSLSGFEGALWLPELIIDIDSESESIRDVLTVLGFLEKIDIELEDVDIFFSGGKGFHIAAPAHLYPSRTVGGSYHMVATMKRYFRDLFGHLSCSIDSTFYSHTGLIRLPYTRHKSGRWKVLIDVEELETMSFEDVKALASFPPHEKKDRPRYEWKAFVPGPVEDAPTVKRDRPEVEAWYPPEYTCHQHMYNSGNVEGQRYNVMRRMVTMWKKLGIAPRQALDLVLSWGMEEADSVLEKKIDEIYEKDHKPYSCHDDIMAQYCDPKCRLFFLLKADRPRTIEEMSVHLDKLYAENQAEYINFGTRWPQIQYNLHPGETMIFTGYAKTGKTSFMHNFLSSLTKKKVLNLHFEMAPAQELQRLVQVAHRLNIRDALQANEVRENWDSHRDQLLSPLRHIVFYRENRNVEAIIRAIEVSNPDLVYLDSLDRVLIDDQQRVDTIQRQQKVLDRLITHCGDNNYVLIIVHHLRKSANKYNIESSDLRGSGDIFQQASHVLAIEYVEDDDEDVRRVRKLMSRRHMEFDARFRGNTSTFQFEVI